MFPLTNAQQSAIDNIDSAIPVIIQQLIVLENQLKDAKVRLPHTNEAGIRITHGSNMQMHRRASLVEYAVYQLAQLVEEK